MAQHATVGLPAPTQGQQPQLTPRQWEILQLVAMGYTNRQIARRTSVAEGTVRKHLQNIFEQLHVGSRTAAVTSAFRPTCRGGHQGRSGRTRRPRPRGAGGHHRSPVVVEHGRPTTSRQSHWTAHKVESADAKSWPPR
jgi:DNA-binding CsgD family transcriptional regulator